MRELKRTDGYVSFIMIFYITTLSLPLDAVFPIGVERLSLTWQVASLSPVSMPQFTHYQLDEVAVIV